MRRLVVALLSISLLVVGIGVSEAQQKDAAAAVDAKLVKNAEKAAKRIVATVSKQIRGDAASAAKRIKALAKAAKSGKNIDALTGAVSAKRAPPISLEQAAQLFAELVDINTELQGTVMERIAAAYAGVGSNPALLALGDAQLPQSAAGTGGPVDTIAEGCEAAWAAGSAVVARAEDSLSSALLSVGFAYTHVDCTPPKLSPPVLAADAGPVLSLPCVLGTFGVSDGHMAVIVGQSSSPVIPAGGATVVMVDAQGDVVSNLGSVQATPLVQFFDVADGTANLGRHPVAIRSSEAGGALPSGLAGIVIPPGPPLPVGDDGLTFTVTPDESPVPTGKSVVFTVEVTNDSAVTANLTIDLSETLDGSTSQIGSKPLQVPAGQTASVTFVTSFFQASSSGDVQLRVVVDGQERARSTFPFAGP